MTRTFSTRSESLKGQRTGKLRARSSVGRIASLFSALTLVAALARPARATEVPILDLLGDGITVLHEAMNGTQVGQIVALQFPDGTSPLFSAGLARDPSTQRLYALVARDPLRTASVAQPAVLQLVEVDPDSGELRVVGAPYPSTRPSGFGLAIDARGRGYTIKTPRLAAIGDRTVSVFRISDAVIEREVDVGFTVDALAYHRDQDRVYAFGHSKTQTGTQSRLAVLSSDASGAVTVGPLRSLAPSLIKSSGYATYIGNDRFLLSTSSVFEVVAASGAVRNLLDTQPSLGSLSLAVGGFALRSVCGDGVLENGETCETADLQICDGCSFCRVDAPGFRCGDGGFNPTCDSECDDGNTLSGDGCSAICREELIPSLPLNLEEAVSLVESVGGEASVLCLPAQQVVSIVQSSRVAAKKLLHQQLDAGAVASGKLLELIATSANAHAGLLDRTARALFGALLDSDPDPQPQTGGLPAPALAQLRSALTTSSLPAAKKQSFTGLLDQASSALSANDKSGHRAALGSLARQLAELTVDSSLVAQRRKTFDLLFSTVAALTAFDPAPAVVTIREGIRSGDFDAAASSHVRSERDAFKARLKEEINPAVVQEIDQGITTNLTLVDADLPMVEYRMSNNSVGASIQFQPDCDGNWAILEF